MVLSSLLTTLFTALINPLSELGLTPLAKPLLSAYWLVISMDVTSSSVVIDTMLTMGSTGATYGSLIGSGVYSGTGCSSCSSVRVVVSIKCYAYVVFKSRSLSMTTSN